MQHDYTGIATGITSADDAVISEPNGADARKATSVLTSIRRLADYVQYLMRNAGILNSARTWTAKQTMSGGIGGLPAPVDPGDPVTLSSAPSLIAPVLRTETITMGPGWSLAPDFVAYRSGYVMWLCGKITSDGSGSWDDILTLDASDCPPTPPRIVIPCALEVSSGPMLAAMGLCYLTDDGELVGHRYDDGSGLVALPAVQKLNSVLICAAFIVLSPPSPAQGS